MSWIKMRTDLRDHPKVVRMASALKADRLRVIGGLWSVWATFDTHSLDGTLEGYTLATLDEGMGWRGFAAALAAVRWLEESEDGLTLPEFDEHNGASAKRRAQETKRKQNDRASDPEAHCSWTSVRKSSASPPGQVSASNADKLRTREELDKRNTPIAPTGADGRFDRFWKAYPSKVGKDAARKAFDKRKPDDGLVDVMVAALGRQSESDRWRRDGGQYIPNPSTWLNEGRWQDEIASVQPAGDVFAGAI
jgi:hypothetical protein